MAAGKASKNSRVPAARGDGPKVGGYFLYKDGGRRSLCTMVTIGKQEVFFREKLPADVAIARAREQLGL